MYQYGRNFSYIPRREQPPHVDPPAPPPPPDRPRRVQGVRVDGAYYPSFARAVMETGIPEMTLRWTAAHSGRMRDGRTVELIGEEENYEEQKAQKADRERDGR